MTLEKEPSAVPTIQELLYTDLNGSPGDPDDIIDEAVEDPRYLERVPPLAAILADPAAEASDRFIACYALASWAEETGYRAVIDAACDPATTPWLGTTLHRLYSVDDTFSLLCTALTASRDLSPSKGTETLRIEAIRAIAGLMPEWYLGRELGYALRGTNASTHAAARTAVERSLSRLVEGPRPHFDLETQVAAVIVALAGADEAGAVRLADRLLELDASTTTLLELSDLVATGHTDRTLVLGRRLEMIGDQAVRRQVGGAMRRRRETLGHGDPADGS